MSGDVGRDSLVGFDREYSRRRFLKTAAWTGAVLSAAGIGGVHFATELADAQPTLGSAAFPTYQGLGDAAILQFAYQLELLEGRFYQQGVDAGILDAFSAGQIAAIRDHEFAHANAIAATLGSLGAAVPAEPAFTYPAGVFSDQVAFLELAAVFEPVGIGAYQGAAPALADKNILAAAGSILGVECEHRTAIDILRGVDPPNNRVFQQSLAFDQVVAAVAPFGVTV